MKNIHASLLQERHFIGGQVFNLLLITILSVLLIALTFFVLLRYKPDLFAFLFSKTQYKKSCAPNYILRSALINYSIMILISVVSLFDACLMKPRISLCIELVLGDKVKTSKKVLVVFGIYVLLVILVGFGGMLYTMLYKISLTYVAFVACIITIISLVLLFISYKKVLRKQ